MGSAPTPATINNLFSPHIIDIIPNNRFPFPPSLTLRYNHSFYSQFSLLLRRTPILINNYFPLAGSSRQYYGTTSTSFTIAFSSHNHNNIDNDDGTVAGVSNAAAEEEEEGKDNDGDAGGGGGGDIRVVSPENKAIISACLVGLLTGFAVVLFNIAVSFCVFFSFVMLLVFFLNVS